MTRYFARASAAAFLTAVFVAAPATAAEPNARVTVVHGLRGLVADIWLDGAKVLSNFEPERATDPMQVPAGRHRIAIHPAGSPAADKPLYAGELDVPGNADLTIVAHLDEAGEPALSVYREQVTPVPPGRSRVVVRHAAATRKIGVNLDQVTLFGAVAPGAQAAKDVPPGSHALSITGASSGLTPLLAPQEVPLDEGTGMVLYLIGSESGNTLTWLAQPVRARATLPTLIATGDSGLREPARSVPPLALFAAVAAALLLVRPLLVRGRPARRR